MKLLDLKQKYESFCFVNQFTELNMKENKPLFKKFGMEFIVVSDSSTEVFKKIRMLTIKEV